MPPRRAIPRRSVRSHSVPASLKYRAPTLAKRSFLHRAIEFRLRAGTYLSRHRKSIATGLTGLACVYMARNVLAWASGVPPIATRYPHYPHWMHTRNAYTALGLEEPTDPKNVPSPQALRSVKRKLALLWHPDKWTRNRLSSPAEAERIYQVIEEAATRFGEYWSRSGFERKYGKFEEPLLRPVTSAAPHFSNDIPSITTILWDAMKAALSPPYKQHLPRTEEEAADFCPCPWKYILRALN
ncbi:hypothetical protein P171DRAFT_526846 [Karstenula rhodostoma CBS 690.94]|uniref:J domain-containing protein n=1 Tax=Karstenula rhodostoma CBS 690.94 TaxID=1392251 RepID=A0A9P4P713_9PLEO|nr:hypothetical protein P171DRAFT_526846 [Karstenula rhodostoma CBS 690.94]